MVAPAEREDLLARREIGNVLARYCTALDRADLAMMETVYWPDGIDIHGIFSGEAANFIPFIIGNISVWFEVATHAISNVDIVIDGNRAASEAYLVSVCRVPQSQAVEIFGEAYVTRHGEGELDAGGHLFMMGGRYLDRFERRAGEWRILQRQVLLDWSDSRPSTRILGQGMFASLRPLGCWGTSDPFYANVV